jgi:hypothetical protein
LIEIVSEYNEDFTFADSALSLRIRREGSLDPFAATQRPMVVEDNEGFSGVTGF